MTDDPAASSSTGNPLRRLLRERTPFVIATPALILANVVIYAAAAGSSGQASPLTDVLIEWGALFGPRVADEWWRLVAAMFLHLGILHLALNCVVLWLVAPMVERLLGSFVFLAVYILTGVIGSIVGLMSHPNVVSVGASGALFGVTGALFAVVFSSGGQMREMLDRRPISFGLGRPDAAERSGASRGVSEPILRMMRVLRVWLFAFLLYNAAFALLPVSVTGIDIAAHVGGFAGGLAVGWIVARDALTRRPPIVRLLLPIILTIALAAMQVQQMRRHTDVLAESLAFDAIDAPHLAEFDAAWNGVSTGHLRPEVAAEQIEGNVLPGIKSARDRSEFRRSEALGNLTRASALDQYGRARDWQHLEQFRSELAQAEAWAAFLSVRQESWQLRIRSLRQNDATLAGQANQLDQAAVSALAAIMRSTAQ